MTERFPAILFLALAALLALLPLGCQANPPAVAKCATLELHAVVEGAEVPDGAREYEYDEIAVLLAPGESFHVSRSSSSVDPLGLPAVLCEIHPAERGALGTWSRSMIGRRIAIVVEEEVRLLGILESGLDRSVLLAGGRMSAEEAANLAQRLDPN